MLKHPTFLDIVTDNLNKLKFETYYNYISDFIAADRDGSTVAVEGEDFNNVSRTIQCLFTGFEFSDSMLYLRLKILI